MERLLTALYDAYNRHSSADATVLYLPEGRHVEIGRPLVLSVLVPHVTVAIPRQAGPTGILSLAWRAGLRRGAG